MSTSAIPTTASSDNSLIQRLLREESRAVAFDELVRAYQRMLYYHIRRMVGSHDDTDDTLQNTFIKVWRNIGNFRGESSLKTWLYRIATNEAITFINSRNRRAAEDIHTLITAEEGTVSHQEHGLTASNSSSDSEAIQKVLQEAIQSLPDKQRAVFNLRYYDEMPYEEMSQVFGTSVGALKASYHHAVKKVETYLTNSIRH